MMSKLCSTLLLGAVALRSAAALPGSTAAHARRGVPVLNEGAFNEAQQVDHAATRAFTGTAITTSTGECLAVDPLAGDFRANLAPIQVARCDGSPGQTWDVLTAGKHNGRAGAMLVVNGLTHACMDFDPRRPAGDQVIMFSCGGRANGEGQTTDAQLFDFQGGAAGPRTLSPLSTQGQTCFTVAGRAVDQTACAAGKASQLFTFGGAGATAGNATVGAGKGRGRGRKGADAGAN